jgi:hypothetical protein
MRHKLRALFSLIITLLGFHRSSYKAFRPNLGVKLFKGLKLKSYTEIQLNSLFIRCIDSSSVIDLDPSIFPLSDAERETLKDLLILRLPKKTSIETHYEKDHDLTHQLTYCFIKPAVALYRDPHL